MYFLNSWIHLNNIKKGTVQNAWISKKIKNIIKVKILKDSLGILKTEEATVKHFTCTVVSFILASYAHSINYESLYDPESIIGLVGYC